MAENIDFFAFDPLNDLRSAWNFVGYMRLVEIYKKWVAFALTPLLQKLLAKNMKKHFSKKLNWHFTSFPC